MHFTAHSPCQLPQLPHHSPLLHPPLLPVPWSLQCPGLAEECKRFLLQCSLALEMQPQQFPTEKAKISFIISLLRERALQWAETIWDQNGPVTQSLDNFLVHLYQLYHLKKGNSSINYFALRSRTLAAASGWLLTTYRQGLEPKLHLHLDAMGLEKFVQLSIRVTQHMQGCLEHQQSQSAVPLTSPPTRLCWCSRTRCGLHVSWDHPSNPGWAAMSARALPVSWC